MRRRTTNTEDSPLGEPDALLASYGERVYRFCLRLCGGRSAEAEDLAQDAFVLAWQHRDGFAGRSSPLTWLMRIALNRHLRLRGKQPAAPVVAHDPERDGNGGPAGRDPTRGVLDRVELARALDLLPARQRAAFLLVKVEGFKYREAAETLGVPQGTVQSDVHAATLRLRAALLSADAEPGPCEAATRCDGASPARKSEVKPHVVL